MTNSEIKNVAKGNKFNSLNKGTCFGIKTETQSETIRVRMRAKLNAFQYRTGLEQEKITGRNCNYNTVIWK